MARMVKCIKLGREAEGLDFPPYPGELGKRIFENVSKEAWKQWLEHQKMLVNENRLNLADKKARDYLVQQMEKYFFGSGADVAAGYTRRHRSRPWRRANTPLNGRMDTNTPQPTEIKLHQKSRVLEISFADGKTFQLPCEFLRVYSPSAEVRGHGPGQEVLQVGKEKRGDHPYRAGGQLRHPAHVLRRPRHRALLMGPAVRLRPAPGGDVAALSQAPGRGRGEPRAGPRAFRAAAEIKIAEPCCPRLHHFLRQERLAPSRSSS